MSTVLSKLQQMMVLKDYQWDFQDMPAGSANDYLTATKDLFAEIAKLISLKDSTSTDIEEKQGQLLKALKNVSEWSSYC